MTVTSNGLWYEVSGLSDGNTWTFDESDRDLSYIDSAIQAWTEWREFVMKNGENKP